MPNENDILNQSQESRQGYFGWILIRSGVAVHSAFEAIAETLVSVAQNRQGYSAWIQTPSGVNIPSIDEQIVGVPETEETVTCVGTNIPSLEEVIVGVEPEPIEPGVGGGTYAPIFPSRYVTVSEWVTNEASSAFELEERTFVEEILTHASVTKNSVRAFYRKPEFFVYPTLPDIEIHPRVTEKTAKFPDELPTGMLSEKRKKMYQQLILHDLL